MKQIVGIHYSAHGQIIPCIYEMQELNGIQQPLLYDDPVIVDTEEGVTFARVAWQRPYCDEVLPSSAPVIRIPTENESCVGEQNEDVIQAARHFCWTCIRERNLEMKIVDVAMLFDKSKLIFYFTAPTRIDFRDLVKDLVREYRTRIELRQIGVRHETQMIGSLGNCGMVCCCRRYLTTFAPVTIKMAKEQNLFLNPTKISGICGRLLCCLSFEQENYENFHKSCPKLGKRYQTDDGPMRVLRANIFRNNISVLPDAGQEYEITLEDWEKLNPKRSEAAVQTNEQLANQQKQQSTYKPEPFINCSVDMEMIEADPNLSMFDAEFAVDLEQE